MNATWERLQQAWALFKADTAPRFSVNEDGAIIDRFAQEEPEDG